MQQTDKAITTGPLLVYVINLPDSRNLAFVARTEEEMWKRMAAWLAKDEQLEFLKDEEARQDMRTMYQNGDFKSAVDHYYEWADGVAYWAGDAEEPDESTFVTPPEVARPFVRLGYVLDKAETTGECAGWSRYTRHRDKAGEEHEVYSFGVVDAEGVQAYATHPGFASVARGAYGPVPVQSDGMGMFIISADSHEKIIVGDALERLDAAVRSFFRTH